MQSKGHRQCYAQISSEERHIALTGMKRSAFVELLEEFSRQWSAHSSIYRLNGEKRRRRVAIKPTDALPSDADKLFFILKYLKTNALQEEIAHDFALSQPHANLWIHALLPVLQQTLRTLKYAPARRNEELSSVLEQYDYVLLDVSERLIERPEDNLEQQASYSGKKNAQR